MPKQNHNQLWYVHLIFNIISIENLFKTNSQMINNPLVQVNSPVTAAPCSGATAVTSTVVNSSGTRSK
jgi:hypothetical protein